MALTTNRARQAGHPNVTELTVHMAAELLTKRARLTGQPDVTVDAVRKRIRSGHYRTRLRAGRKMVLIPDDQLPLDGDPAPMSEIARLELRLQRAVQERDEARAELSRIQRRFRAIAAFLRQEQLG